MANMKGPAGGEKLREKTKQETKHSLNQCCYLNWKIAWKRHAVVL